MANATSTGPDGDQSAGVGVDVLLGEALLVDTMVAGAAGVDRAVSWCVPWEDDHAGGTSGADLSGCVVVLTDAALIADPSVVERASRRGATALAVRQSGSGDAGDPTRPDLVAARTAADACSLPLLMLGRGTGFREVSRLIGAKVLTQSAHVLEYGTRVHRRLGDVFARGGGLTGLATTMADLSGATVAVLGTSGEVLAAAGPRSGEQIGAASERATALLTSDPGLNGPEHPVHHAEAWELRLDLGGESVLLLVSDVRIAEHQLGSLLLLEQVGHTDHDLSQHRVMLHEGVSLTASELLRQQSIREAQERARNDFVHALLHGRFTDSLELNARAEHYRFPVDSQFSVFIVSDSGLHVDDDRDRRRAREASRAVRALAKEQGLTSMSAVIGSMIVVVQELPRTDEDALAKARDIQQIGKRIHRRVSSLLGVDVRVSCGRAAERALGIASSYRDARTAEVLTRHVGTARVNSYADLRVFAALAASAASPAAQTFAEEILDPLRRAESQQSSLEELVLTYIEESGNINATARRLHLHRNTMLYKLDRASRALQLDIRSAETQFMVWLAHHLEALRDVTVALDRELTLPT